MIRTETTPRHLLPLVYVQNYAATAHELLRLMRRRLRTNELWIIALAVIIGVAAGAAATAISAVAHTMNRLLFNIGEGVSLSSLSSIDEPRLLVLPAGGMVLGMIILLMRRSRAPVDVVEANALHGGRIPVLDTLLVVAQTVISNGMGASVGLEAAYAQAGGGFSSVVGRWLNLRRSDMRTLVGAGAGGAIAAAFGAPLTGAFYAFEIVIGAYTSASISAVTAACVSAVITAQALGKEPYLLISYIGQSGTLEDYALYASLGIACAVLGIGLMRLVSAVEATLRRLPLPEAMRPVIGGLLLIPIARISPHALSAGHGALHLTVAANSPLSTLTAIFFLKAAASVVSLGFGFRGGLFFASLFLGALAGQIFSALLVMLPALHPLPLINASLVGMAGLAVAIVGGPMTMSLLVLEQTHDLSITIIVLSAALCSSAFVRATFGYSFSTWRLHLRGEMVRSPRDIGWTKTLTAYQMMRKSPATASPQMTIAEFRHTFPLGSTTRVILADADRYKGIVLTSSVFADVDDVDRPIGPLAILQDETLSPDMDISTIIQRFEDYGADDLAVVDANHVVLGMLTEVYVRKRFADELDQAQRELFGEVSARPRASKRDGKLQSISHGRS